MPNSLDVLEPRCALVEIARDFYGRGWMAGTAGNLSARATPESFWITASGCAKGRLQEEDFLRVAIADGGVLQRFDSAAKPSAETAIHSTIYQLFADAGACLHVHTVDATRVSLQLAADAAAVRLPPIEMLKGLDVWEQDPDIALPLFDNLLDVSHIAEAIRQRFTAQTPRIPALLIRGHGITVWGESLQQAYNRVEVLEFVLSVLARA